MNKMSWSDTQYASALAFFILNSSSNFYKTQNIMDIRTHNVSHGGEKKERETKRKCEGRYKIIILLKINANCYYS